MKSLEQLPISSVFFEAARKRKRSWFDDDEPTAELWVLGSLVEGLSEEFKYALVAGAVTGGGLTVIANAPNPAGFAILRGHFEDGSIHPLGLLVAALPPTINAILAFRLL